MAIARLEVIGKLKIFYDLVGNRNREPSGL
jgi:hypothetical protein